MSPFRILSLDGGGIRGWLTASLLQRLQNDLKQQGYPDFLEKTPKRMSLQWRG
jgi:patatin-like phospholipase/acyl hydrolase